MANITIDIDEKLKSQAEDLFSDLGMDLTTAFTIFVKQSIREQGLPFSVCRDYNDETKRIIEEASSGINLSKSFDTIAELMDDLNAVD